METYKLITSTNPLTIKEVTGKTFTVKGKVFVIPDKKYDTIFKVYSIDAGLGFHVEGKTKSKIIKEVEDRFKYFDEERMDKFIKSRGSVDKVIAIYKNNIKHNNELYDIIDNLRKKTGLTLRLSSILGYPLNKDELLNNPNTCGINVFQLDNELYAMGYEESKDGSMKDYLIKTYGKDIAETIEKYL